MNMVRTVANTYTASGFLMFSCSSSRIVVSTRGIRTHFEITHWHIAATVSHAKRRTTNTKTLKLYEIKQITFIRIAFHNRNVKCPT